MTLSRPVARHSGFTLIEIVIVIVTLGILAAVAIPYFADISDGSRISATRDEMQRLKRAIVGNPAAVAAGSYVDRGFAGDVGQLPASLTDLAVKPDSIPPYNRLTRIGWNGPYIDDDANSYLTDAWGNPYVYDRAGRRLISPGAGGSGDSIIVTF
jgi:prepilin-type N-terminal cleavage/methylation domain-containing protein